MSEYQSLCHTFQPIYSKDSRILILGTFPSVKSRENAFYYGHPRNRFWKVLAGIQGENAPVTIEEKKEFLLRNKIAIWDVISKCDIVGSSDSSIKNVVPAELSIILNEAPIRQIFANGGKAFELYQKYSYPNVKREIQKLPSTSPANAAWSIGRLIEEWKVIRNYLE